MRTEHEMKFANPSRAKAQVDPIALMYGLKLVPSRSVQNAKVDSVHCAEAYSIPCAETDSAHWAKA